MEEDGTGGITTCLHKFFHFFAWVLMHLVLLAMFVAQISTFFFYPSSTHVGASSQFYCVISCYFPLN
jgi:hypothetical protein